MTQPPPPPPPPPATSQYCVGCSRPLVATATVCPACGTPAGRGGIGTFGSMPPNNGMAIASMVLGIVGFFYGIPAILALIFGYISRKQIRESNGAQRGNGMAIAGIVLGWIWVAFFVLMIILAIVAAANNSNSPSY